MCLKEKSATNRIDSCLVAEIKEINKDKCVKTLLSCCGHGRYSKTIVVRNKCTGKVYEFFSGVELPDRYKNGKQRKRYYRKDEDGFYYLPWIDERFSGINGMKSTRNNDDLLYCPFCERQVYIGSEYLREVFIDNDFTYWFACLVTHYRHEHIRYYDNCWRNPGGYGDKNPEYKYNTHEDFRKIINNRAKRQIIRTMIKDKSLLIKEKKMLLLGAGELQYNDEKTKELLEKQLKLIKHVVIYKGEKK